MDFDLKEDGVVFGSDFKLNIEKEEEEGERRCMWMRPVQLWLS
jgi:hypothetical protein